MDITEKHYGNSVYRPDLAGLIIPGKHGNILANFYVAGGEGTHPTVIICHGIPGNEQNYDLAQELRRQGFNAMIFHYSGSWGSTGNYSLQNDLDDAETILDFVLNDEIYHCDKDKIYCVGHSLGGFVCGNLSAKRDEIKAAALLMPCDIGGLPEIMNKDHQMKQILKESFNDWTRWLTNVTGDELIQEAYEHAKEFKLVSKADKLIKMPLLVINGSLDIYTPKKDHAQPLIDKLKEMGGTQIQEHVFETDHSANDYRLELINTVVNFFKSI